MEDEVVITYTNYKGITSKRRIVPHCVWFGSTAFHKTKQWLLDAYDFDRGGSRTFAMSSITSWSPVPVPDSAPDPISVHDHSEGV